MGLLQIQRDILMFRVVNKQKPGKEPRKAQACTGLSHKGLGFRGRFLRVWCSVR